MEIRDDTYNRRQLTNVLFALFLTSESATVKMLTRSAEDRLLAVQNRSEATV